MTTVCFLSARQSAPCTLFESCSTLTISVFLFVFLVLHQYFSTVFNIRGFIRSVYSLTTWLYSTSFRLVGDVLLATGFLSYSGPFNQAFRTLLLDNWKKEMRKMKIPFSEVMKQYAACYCCCCCCCCCCCFFTAKPVSRSTIFCLTKDWREKCQRVSIDNRMGPSKIRDKYRLCFQKFAEIARVRVRVIFGNRRKFSSQLCNLR